MDARTFEDETFPVADLVARIAAGDRVAETLLVQRYSHVVFYVLRRRLRDDAAAHDLHQETFIVVLRRLRAGELKSPEALPGFLRQTAINLAIGVDRKDVRRQTDVDSEAIELIADESRNALEELEQRETVGFVRRSINALTAPRDRELLKRYFVEQEEKESICADLALSTEHFDRVLYRAKKRLAEIVMQVLARTGAARR